MRSILKLLSANIRHRKGAFAGIIILMAVITLSYAITVSNDRNLSVLLTEGYTAQGGGDWMVSLQAANMQEEGLEGLRQHAAVEKVTETERLFLIGDSGANDFVSYFLEDSDCYPLFNAKGDGFTEHTPLQRGEVYLSSDLEKYAECGIGKTLRFAQQEGDNAAISYTVKGYVQCIRHYNTVLMTPEDYAELRSVKGITVAEMLLDVFLRPGTDQKALRRELNEQNALFRQERSIYVETHESFYEDEMLIASTGTRILAVFVVLLVTIVLIVMHSSIATTVETEYTTIGILKASGFGKWQLRAVWILQYLIALLLGTVLGLLLAIPLTDYFGTLFKSISNHLTDNRVAFGLCVPAALAVMLLCSVFVIAATAKIGRISPVRAISGGRSEIYFDSPLQVRIRRRGLHFLTALRQCTSRFGNCVSSVLIAALLVFFLCTVMILARGINSDLFLMPSGDIIIAQYGAEKKRDPELEAQILRTAQQYDPKAEDLYLHRVTVDAEGEQVSLQLYSRTDACNIPFEGRLPQYDNEVTVTELLAEKLGKKIGDSITLRYENRSADYVITGFMQTAINRNGVCEMTLEASGRIGLGFPALGYLRLTDKSKKAEIVKAVNDTFGARVIAKEEDPDGFAKAIDDYIRPVLAAVIAAVYLVSVIFAAVVVVMICRRSFLQERTDIGIFRAIGFSVPELRLQFAFRFLLTALCGAAAGAAASVFLSKPLLSVIMRIIGISRFMAKLDAGVWLIPAAAISAAFFVFAFLASRRVRTVSVRALVTE